MCGLAGFLDLSRRTAPDALAARAEAMADAIRHRGPDDGEILTEPEVGLAMAFRRLAIIDLSDAGRQPMTSADGRWSITFNGEIYNHAELRRALEAEGATFRGRSDTEALLEHVARHGPVATAEALVGMFAIALWDRREGALWLFRDRLGIKPLYFGRQDDLVFWGSELKALAAHPAFRRDVDPAAVAGFLRFNYVPAPRSIYRGVEKLAPGAWARIDAADGSVRRGHYWSLADAATPPSEPENGSEDRWLDGLEERLRTAVADRMIADVPLGALLSGGIDSATVVALMQQESAQPVRTFTIGFGAQEYDEAAHAKQVAAHLHTDHTELYLQSRQARDLIPSLPDWYDEPFADSSALPTYLVSRLAREHVTVALSGDGGDETFFGYTRHRALARLARLDAIPGPARRGLAAALNRLGPTGARRLAALLPEAKRPRLPEDKAAKLARALAADGFNSRYLDIVGHWSGAWDTAAAGLLADGADAPDATGWLPAGGPSAGDPAARAAWLDTLTYLPDDILTKVDRASMAVSLEARVPLLDHRVVEYAWRLPTGHKLRDGIGKWPLRQILYRHVPRHLVDRPKAGFAIPLGDWLRGPLRDWAETLLDADRLAARGFVDPAPVRAAWRQHLDGEGMGRAEDLWGVLMLEAWATRWLD